MTEEEVVKYLELREIVLTDIHEYVLKLEGYKSMVVIKEIVISNRFNKPSTNISFIKGHKVVYETLPVGKYFDFRLDYVTPPREIAKLFVDNRIPFSQ